MSWNLINQTSYSKNTNELPKVGVPVFCQIQHCISKTIIEEELIYVIESDCSWKTADDHSELSYEWDVIAWRNKEQNPK